MKLEVNVLENKLKWKQILKQYDANYTALRQKFEKEKEMAQRKDIYYGQDMKFQTIVQQTKQDTDVLKQTQKELLNVELNAVDLMDTLDQQTAQINKIKENVVESNNLLDNMGKTIKKMKKRWWA